MLGAPANRAHVRSATYALAFGVAALATPAAVVAKTLPAGTGIAQESQFPDGTGVNVATVRAGADTALLLIDPDSGDVDLSRIVEGRFSLPQVAMDGSTDGVSAGGEMIVLTEDQTDLVGRQASTTLRVYGISDLGDGRTALRRRDAIELAGDFEVTAIAADGDTAIVVENRPASDGGNQVRRLDLQSGKLSRVASTAQLPAETIIRNGLATARTSSADGRWAYTLLEGRQAAILALDTATGQMTAVPLSEDVTRKLRNDPIGFAELKQAGDNDSEITLSDSAGRRLASLDTNRLSVETPRATRVASVGGELITTATRRTAAVICASIPALRLWNSRDDGFGGFADGETPGAAHFTHYTALAFAADLAMQPFRLQRAAYIGCSAGLRRQG